MAAWSEDTARLLREMRSGTWDGQDPSLEPGWTDRVNARWFERSRRMPLPQVRRAFVDGRRHLLEAFGALEEISADADEWFEETASIHYRKHLADLDRWVARLRRDRRRA